MRCGSVLALLAPAALLTVAAVSQCPQQLNTETVCQGAVTEKQCPTGFVFEESILGCALCPGCVKYQGYNDTCQDPETAPRRSIYTVHVVEGAAHVAMTTCGPGLTCDEVASRCVPADNTTRCLTMLDKFRTADPPDTLGYEPVCEPDGTYAPVQCQGSSFSGICFCVDEKGTRIYGRNLIKHRDTMNCACSRYFLQLGAEKREDVTLHCMPDGSYEPVQCDGEVCFCVNSTTTQPYGGTVARKQWTALPCYDDSYFPGDYERECESMNLASYKVSKLLSAHGVRDATFPSACNPDGGYYPKYCSAQDQVCKCRDRAGNPIGSYRVDSSHMDDANDMNCQCAVDHNDYDPVAYKTHNLKCDVNGNYKPEQCNEDQCYCVDDWGTRTTVSVNVNGPVGALVRCCLPCLRKGTLDCTNKTYVPSCPHSLQSGSVQLTDLTAQMPWWRDV